MGKRNGLAAVIKTFNMFGDLIILNLCFIVCCLPIVTVGPALSGLYYAIFRLDVNDGGIIKLFLKGFRSEFKKNFIAGLLILAVLAATGFSAYILYATDNLTTLPIIIICIVLFWILGVTGYLFPLNAQFSNPLKISIRNALILTVTNLPKTLLIIFINIIQIVLYIWKQDLLGRIFILALALSFSAPAYFNYLIIKKIFKPFVEQASKEKPAEVEN